MLSRMFVLVVPSFFYPLRVETDRLLQIFIATDLQTNTA